VLFLVVTFRHCLWCCCHSDDTTAVHVVHLMNVNLLLGICGWFSPRTTVSLSSSCCYLYQLIHSSSYCSLAVDSGQSDVFGKALQQSVTTCAQACEMNNQATTPIGYCRSMAFVAVQPYCVNARQKQMPRRS